MHTDPIEKIEKLLRELIHKTLSSEYGENWTRNEEIGLGIDWHDRLVKYRENEIENTKSTRHYDWLIAYSQFGDLGKIIEKNKGLFTPIFGDYEKYLQFYNVINELRNTVQHNRDVRPHQHNLLEGIAGEFEDIINLWRIGNILEVTNTIYQFVEFIETTDKSDEKILSEVCDCISTWRNTVIQFLNDNEIKDFTEDYDKYSCSINSRHLVLNIKVSNQPTPNTKIDDIDYKSFSVNISFESSSSLNIDDLLELLGKPYKHIEYELKEGLDLERLLEYGRNGGININRASSIIFNHKEEITQVECQLVYGKLNIGVSKYIPAAHGRTGGKIFATGGTGIYFWRFHNLIKAELLIRFMIGDLAPRTIIHLLELSQ